MKMFKVLSPTVKKDGSTFWMRVGTGFLDEDGDIRVYLDMAVSALRLRLVADTPDEGCGWDFRAAHLVSQ
jgi:hypothetical protein